MIKKTFEECATAINTFDDSNELAGKLLEISNDIDAGSAYYLRECATQIHGMYELLRDFEKTKFQDITGRQKASGKGDIEKTTPQPIKLLRKKEITELCGGIADSTFWQWIKQGKFPKQISIGENTSAWKLDDVYEWLESKGIYAYKGDSCLRINDVMKYCGGISRSTVFNWVKEAKLPNHKKLNNSITVWSRLEIEKWIFERKTKNLTGKDVIVKNVTLHLDTRADREQCIENISQMIKKP